ncbi:MAG TPA: hypothetical protein PLL72_13605 [Burkholderiaceae bacterium]|nr:hypothetical protein [Burkholderiaceae bacterium]
MADFRPFLASLTSPMVALFPSATLAVRQLDASGLFTAAPGGEAPLRAIGLFLMLFPIFYLLLAVAAHAMAWSLMHLGLDTRRRFVAGAAGLALALAPVAAGIAQRAGWPFAANFLPTWAGLSALFVASALPSAACWWWLAGPGRARLSGRQSAS